LTTAGKITDFIRKADLEIVNLLHNNKLKASELIYTIGVNILLLDHLDFQLLKNIDSEILKQEQLNRDSEIFDTEVWVYADLFDEDNFETYFDSFDDTFDSFDSASDDAGCNSCDSGCSSCSECGGLRLEIAIDFYSIKSSTNHLQLVSLLPDILKKYHG